MDSYNDISPQGYSSPHIIRAISEQERKNETERNETLQQLPLLKAVIGRLNTRIVQTDSVQNALRIADKYDIDRETALVVLDIVRPLLEAERKYIETRVKRAEK